MSTSQVNIEQLAINTIRTLSMDAVQAANSGHPGTPMALAPAAYVLYNEVMRYNPARPTWPNRDRFVLSCGHASALLYSMLHLAEVKQVGANGKVLDEPAVPLDDLRRFRQLDSRCPGHPEYRHTGGVETTTGPLGQGIANSVGMAMAARWLGARYNRPDFELFDYDTYVLCSDGDLMEGVGAEAASIAGHLQLANLCWIYDDNHITIEGKTDLAFSEDVGRRFEGYGWNVQKVADVNDLPSLRAAVEKFKKTTDRPTLIIVRSVIGYGSPNKANTHGAHGAPLGTEEIKLTKAAYGWPENESFLVPAEVRKHFEDGIIARGQKANQAWDAMFAEYKKKFAELAAEIELIERGELPADWDADMQPLPADPKGMASRVSSGKVLNQIAKRVPWLLGGSADLAPSNNSMLTFEKVGDLSAENPAGRNLHFGIREHAMGSILNGMVLSGLRAYGATFFVFTDYMRPPIRLAALMGLPVFYIFTHDSIGVGEDGPTHQPIEHLAALRAIPNLLIVRPADANEVSEAYRIAMLQKHRPTALILTRQNLPTLDRAVGQVFNLSSDGTLKSSYANDRLEICPTSDRLETCPTKFAPAAGAQKGGYILADAADGKPDVIIIGTGSEVSLCAAAYEKLTAEGVKVRVVSLPCWELFDEQPAEYRDAVLPPNVTSRVAVELGIKQGWEKYIGVSGKFIGMSGYGASAPLEVVLPHFGMTVENIAAAAKELSIRQKN